MNNYIKDKYTFKEVYELQKLPLDTKIKISVEVLRRAFEISKHNIALAFSSGKDSQVVADLAERYLPETVQKNVQRRSLAFPGVAQAMAQQWGDYLISELQNRRKQGNERT